MLGASSPHTSHSPPPSHKPPPSPLHSPPPSHRPLPSHMPSPSHSPLPSHSKSHATAVSRGASAPRQQRGKATSRGDNVSGPFLDGRCGRQLRFGGKAAILLHLEAILILIFFLKRCHAAVQNVWGKLLGFMHFVVDTFVINFNSYILLLICDL
nr:hypothetical protein Iba_chr09dCG11040 [Ipomoea batatas]